MARKTLPPIEADAAPSQEGAVITRAEQKKLAELRDQAATVLAGLGLPVEYSFDSFVEIIKSQTLQLHHAATTLGAALIAVRAHEPADKFRAMLEQLDIGEYSAQAMMALARNVAKSDGHRRVYETLGASKATVLFGRLDEAEIQSLGYDDQQLDEMAGKSVRELKAELQRAKDSIASMKETHKRLLQRKDEKINELDAQLNRDLTDDADKRETLELLQGLDTVVSKVTSDLYVVEDLMSDLRARQHAGGHVLATAAQEKLNNHVSLLAARVAKLNTLATGG